MPIATRPALYNTANPVNGMAARHIAATTECGRLGQG